MLIRAVVALATGCFTAGTLAGIILPRIPMSQ